MSITKIDAAERQLKVAVKLYFDGEDPLAVYTLAAAARRIIADLCERKGGVQSFLDYVRHPHYTRDGIQRLMTAVANFLKHADRDPDGVLAEVTDGDCAALLFVAIFDFGNLCGGKPVELQVFEVWFYSQHLGEEFPPANTFFPGIGQLDLAEQKRLGREKIAWAREQPEFQMAYSKDWADYTS